MSAYGTIVRASATDPSTLVPRSILLPNGDAITVFPCTRATVSAELVEYLAAVFNAVVDEGRTYPQMGTLSIEQFAAYFFAEDCFVGLLDKATDGVRVAGATGLDREKSYTFEQARAGRSYEEAVLGMFCEHLIPDCVPGSGSTYIGSGWLTVVPGLRWHGDPLVLQTSRL